MQRRRTTELTPVVVLQVHRMVGTNKVEALHSLSGVVGFVIPPTTKETASWPQ